MKRFISICILITLFALHIPASAEKRISVVTTIFPIYDWVREIVDGTDDTEITLLLDKGVDLHSFQPTAQDILKVVTADIFIYVGGESDEWVHDALASAVNKDMTVLNLIDLLGENALEEELVEGMQGEEDDEEEDAEEVEYDEHVWLSLKNAQLYVKKISDALSELDERNADTYQHNATAYIEKLDELDARYAETVKSAARNTLLFADRFPFRYMVDDYGLTYFAAFVGCSAETEASFETIIFLTEKLNELKLPAIIALEGSDHRMAETIRNASKDRNQAILTMNSLQGKVENSYLDIMESNLNVLTEALN